jgi:hypothetical protein
LASFTLTPGVDTFVGSPGDNTVYGTAATLTGGDSLTGGSGTNVLDLIGSGYFDVTQLAKFTGFQRINLNNATNSFSSLVLSGQQPIEVDTTGYAYIYVSSLSNWNSRDIIKGDTSYSYSSTNLTFYSVTGGSVTYDLTSSTLSRLNSISASSSAARIPHHRHRQMRSRSRQAWTRLSAVRGITLSTARRRR